jgi:rhodopsin domain-containing protein
MADNSTAAAPALPPWAFDDRRWISYFAVTFCLTIATTSVALRIWTRKFIIDQMGMDDYGAIVSLLITWGCGIAIATSTLYGQGRHVMVLDPADIPLYFRVRFRVWS